MYSSGVNTLVEILFDKLAFSSGNKVVIVPSESLNGVIALVDFGHISTYVSFYVALLLL